MKTSIRALVVLVMLSAGVADAQSLAGNWQGTLQAGKDLRIVIVISGADAAGLKAVLYSIDQSGQGVPASSVTLQGSALRMAFPGIGVTFDGSMGADGNSVTGTFTQGGKPLPMTLARATPDTAWAIPAPPAPMAADAKAVFEVATIKPSNPDRQGGSCSRSRAGRSSPSTPRSTISSRWRTGSTCVSSQADRHGWRRRSTT